MIIIMNSEDFVKLINIYLFIDVQNVRIKIITALMEIQIFTHFPKTGLDAIKLL